MNQDQFKRAKYLKEFINKLRRELIIWEETLNVKSKLAYIESTGNCGTTSSPFYSGCHFSDDIFTAFRESVMNDLKLKIINAEKQFREI